MTSFPFAVRTALDRGVFCHVAAATPFGPHVTPMVFAVAGDRLWVTTARRSVKAGAWRSDPRVSGLVRAGREAVVFVGETWQHDALDPGTWRRSVREGPTLALASARFARKNARFFAGYTFDARRVPLAWTPPGRVLVELRPQRLTLVEDGRAVEDGIGRSPDGLDRFRALRAGAGVLDALPAWVRRELGAGGPAALAVEGRDGPVVLPATWVADGAGLYAVLPEDVIALAGAPPEPRLALAIDRPSSWRARDMVGAMVRGRGEVFVADRIVSGAAGVRRIAASAGLEGAGAAVVRVRPERLVWWKGWDSGTVMVA